MIFFWFMLWTLMIYWMHRLAHVLPLLKKVHFGHHRTISTNRPPKWCFNNILMFQDNWISTVDVVIFELIPTVLFCLITGEWWILGLYYFWSAFIQESIEHNPNFNKYPWITSGQWHLIHHKKECNFGLFTSIWDIVFCTNSNINIER